MKAIWTFFQALPSEAQAAIYGALLGSALTLLGALLTVWLSNRHTRKLQGALIASQDKAQALDRLMELRREVYLPAIDAMVDLFGTFSRLIDPSVGFAILRDSGNRFSTAIARVQMVASADTIRAVSVLQRRMTAALADLTLPYMQATVTHGDFERAKEAQRQAGAELTQLTERMKAGSLDGTLDQNQMRRIEGASQFAKEQLNEATAEIERLSVFLLKYQEDMAHRVAVITFDSIDDQRNALVAVRRDMSIDGGADVLAEQMTIATEDGKKHLEAFFQEHRRIRDELVNESRPA